MTTLQFRLNLQLDVFSSRPMLRPGMDCYRRPPIVIQTAKKSMSTWQTAADISKDNTCLTPHMQAGCLGQLQGTLPLYLKGSNLEPDRNAPTYKPSINCLTHVNFNHWLGPLSSCSFLTLQDGKWPDPGLNPIWQRRGDRVEPASRGEQSTIIQINWLVWQGPQAMH